MALCGHGPTRISISSVGLGWRLAGPVCPLLRSSGPLLQWNCTDLMLGLWGLSAGEAAWGSPVWPRTQISKTVAMAVGKGKVEPRWSWLQACPRPPSGGRQVSAGGHFTEGRFTLSVS